MKSNNRTPKLILTVQTLRLFQVQGRPGLEKHFKHIMHVKLKTMLSKQKLQYH